MKAVLLPRAPHHREWCGPFGEGLRRHGWTVEVASQWKPCDLLVCWGVRRIVEMKVQKQHGGQVCILERGYLGDRFKWTSVSFGGELNGRAQFRTINDPARFNEHFSHLMQPWARQEGYALIVGQVPGDMSLRPIGGTLDGWYRWTAAELMKRGHDVRFRPHPEAVRRGIGGGIPGVETIGGDLQTALAGASHVVSYNSNTAVEAVLSGVPAVSMDIGSMAYGVTGHEPGEIVTPDRIEWAARLAWKQFSADEMASGFCWDVVGERIEAAA